MQKVKNMRTNIDFSKHELIIKQDSLCKIHWLKRPNLMRYNVKFIHIENLLVVTGDFGRWTFERDFNPEGFEKSGVSDSYWCEKIRLGSVQKTGVFDSEVAEQSIQEKIDNLLENSEADDDNNICFENNNEQEEYEFWNELLYYCSDEIEFINYFRGNRPDSLDFENLPAYNKQNEDLDAIFDAFEEIMKRYNNKVKKSIFKIAFEKIMKYINKFLNFKSWKIN